jgi:site-specific recombinase XerD
MAQRISYSQAVTEYLQNCVSSGKAKDTLDGYKRTLENLGSFIARLEIVDLEDVTTRVLAAWKNERSAEVSATSMRLYLTHVHSFFDFCVDVEMIEKTPYSKTVLKIDKAAIQAETSKPYGKLITEKQLIKILTNSHPDNMHRSAYERNRAILLVLLTSGMRNKSLRTLTESDLDWENNRIWLRDAKGGKSDYVLFPPMAQEAVKDYLASGHRPSNLPINAPLFGRIDEGGSWVGYTRQNLSERVLDAVNGFCGEDGHRSHAMRHSMATILKKRGVEDREISELLMHSDGDAPAVTQRYIENDHKELFDKVGKIFAQMCVG